MRELAYRFRRAEPGDAPLLRPLFPSSLARPESKTRRAGFGAISSRGDVLLLEKYEDRTKTWAPIAFVDYHMRVDDTLTLRDAGTTGDSLQPAPIKLLLSELFRSLSPQQAVVKVRQDQAEWNELFGAMPGFVPDGQEYRRPYYFMVWGWTPERERRVGPASQAQGGPRRRFP